MLLIPSSDLGFKNKYTKCINMCEKSFLLISVILLTVPTALGVSFNYFQPADNDNIKTTENTSYKYSVDGDSGNVELWRNGSILDNTDHSSGITNYTFEENITSKGLYSWRARYYNIKKNTYSNTVDREDFEDGDIQGWSGDSSNFSVSSSYANETNSGHLMVEGGAGSALVKYAPSNSSYKNTTNWTQSVLIEDSLASNDEINAGIGQCGASSNLICIDFRSNGSIVLSDVRPEGGGDQKNVIIGSWDTQTWYDFNVNFTESVDDFTIYLNGQNKGTYRAEWPDGDMHKTQFWISNNNGGAQYDGYTDDVRYKELVNKTSKVNETNGTKRTFDVVDNFVPEINESTIDDDRKANDLNLSLTIDDKGETDISSYTGTGTELSFTNSTLKLDKLLPIEATYSVTDFKDETSASVLVNVSTDESNLREHAYNHNLSTQRVNKSIEVFNDGGLQLTYDFEFKNYGTTVSGESWIAHVDPGRSLSNTGVWEGDWLAETEYGFTPADNYVVLDTNYTGKRPLEVVEQKGVQWTGVDTTGFVTVPARCGQLNNTEVAVAASSSTNYSIGFDCNPGTKGNPTQNIVDLGDGAERVWYNSSDMEVYTNKTEESVFRIPANKSNLKSPDDRDGGSLNAYVDGVSASGNTALNVSDTGSHFRITVGDQFQNSSLHTTDDSWSVTYTLGASSSSGSTGGSGGGVTSESVAEVPPQLYNVRFGGEAVRSFTVENIQDSDVTVGVRVPNTPSCDLFQVETSASAYPPETTGSGEFGDRGEYEIEGGLYLGDRISVEPGVRVTMPEQPRFEELANRNGTVRCEVETTSSAGEVEPLVLEVEPGVDPLAGVKNFVEQLRQGGGVAELLNSVFVGVRGVLVVALFWLLAVAAVLVLVGRR